jgi:hypothetical protein
MTKIETFSLLKVYSTFVLVVVALSLVFLHYKNTTNENETTIIPVSNNSNNTLSATEAQPQISIGSTTPLQSPVSVASLEATTSPNTASNQIQEIDIIEEDKRTHIPNVCDSPITYTLGTFDTRFNISKNYFLQKINESASLWNDAVGKKILEYSPTKTSNGVTINLVYDGRQARTDDTKLLVLEIENSQNTASLLKKQFETAKIDFDAQKEIYLERVSTFTARQKVYSDSVSSWNEKGGAPRAEYDTLIAEKEWLMKEAEYLDGEQKRLNDVLLEINTKVAKYNDIINFSNERVALGNQFANKKFTEGKYNPNTGEVTIYQFSDEIKLSRVLTHELGHVLGIDHTKSKDSIMYAINSATGTELNYEDLREARTLCQ